MSSKGLKDRDVSCCTEDHTSRDACRRAGRWPSTSLPVHGAWDALQRTQPHTPERLNTACTQEGCQAGASRARRAAPPAARPSAAPPLPPSRRGVTWCCAALYACASLASHLSAGDCEGAQARAAAVATERLRTADWERSTLASGLPGGMCTCRKGLGPVHRELHRSTKCVLTYTRAGGPDGASEARAAKRLSMSGDRDVRSPLRWQSPAAAPSGSARLSPAAPLRRRCTAAAS